MAEKELDHQEGLLVLSLNRVRISEGVTRARSYELHEYRVKRKRVAREQWQEGNNKERRR